MKCEYCGGDEGTEGSGQKGVEEGAKEEGLAIACGKCAGLSYVDEDEEELAKEIGRCIDRWWGRMKERE